MLVPNICTVPQMQKSGLLYHYILHQIIHKLTINFMKEIVLSIHTHYRKFALIEL